MIKHSHKLAKLPPSLSPEVRICLRSCGPCFQTPQTSIKKLSCTLFFNFRSHCLETIKHSCKCLIYYVKPYVYVCMKFLWADKKKLQLESKSEPQALTLNHCHKSSWAAPPLLYQFLDNTRNALTFQSATPKAFQWQVAHNIDLL